MARLIGKKEKALIHVAKAKLGMSDEVYREMLAGVGVKSSKDLTYPKFDEVMRRMKVGGFQPVHKSAAKSGMDTAPAESRKRLVWKIGAILAEMGLPWSYADGIASQMFGVMKVRWLEPGQLHKVVAALMVHKKRKENRDERADQAVDGGKKETARTQAGE